ncbi:MAG TPA: DUF1080 domain-containing protein [Thermoleophilaceae bacterium]|nr:DUF1080 domain-containing protein [Thermoleophilaceae bacterium]
MRRAAVLGAVALALAAAWPSGASAAKLDGPRHGVVDFGDRVPYTVKGKRCASTRVRARVAFGTGDQRGVVRGRRSRARRNPVAGGCAGAARIPGFRALRRAGWQAGEATTIRLGSRAGRLPLRYARIEADHGDVVAGDPTVIAANDQDTRGGDNALLMNKGDVVALGRANVRRIDSVAFRFCVAGAPNPVLPGAGVVVPERVEPSAVVSIRQDSPDGAPFLRPVDLSNTLQNFSRFATLGFGGCYRLLPVPVTGRAMEDAPELFLKIEDAPPDSFTLNSLDLAGTGAKLPHRSPRDPRGMKTIFDGTSFDGFSQTGCALRDGAATNLRTGDNAEFGECSMEYDKPIRDVVIRLEVRRENFYDNAGIYLGQQEIQLRSAGEYLPGGFFGQYAARWQKLTSFPEWSTIEIVQIGARHVVTVNGRTVTDVMRADGPPEPYELRLVTQPQWSYRTAIETGFGNEGEPNVVNPSEWGAFWFRNVRLLECGSADKPVCRRLADARRGQVPVPEGATNGD